MSPQQDRPRKDYRGGADASLSRNRLDRRTLVKGAAAAGAGVLTIRETIAFAQGGNSSMGIRASAQDGAPGVESMSVAELQAALAAGDLTVRTLVQACLDRIAELDGDGPALNAVIELNPDALAIADELDAELAGGTPRGPLHGIPVLIKDNIATADAMETTAGSLALVGIRPVQDSTIARLLREGGAVILGKTNLSEWANIRSFQSTSGWSGRGGQTLNPYVLDRNPSGSSSGSAAAVAAGYVPLTIGTETNGSIVSPAGHCGVVGIKPTVGLVSRFGVIPISHSQDTAGPMARSVADAAALLTLLAVQDEEDPAQEGPSFEAAGAVGIAAEAADEADRRPHPRRSRRASFRSIRPSRRAACRWSTTLPSSFRTRSRARGSVCSARRPGSAH